MSATSNNVSGFSMSMKSTQSFSVTSFEGGPTPKPAGGCEPAAPSTSTTTTTSTSGSPASSPSIDVKRLAGELKAISAEMGNKPTCGCASKSPAPTSGANPAPTSGASPAPTSGAPAGTPAPGGADKAGPAGQAGKPGPGAMGGKKFQQMLQGIMQMLQKAMKSFGMQGA
jgi:hypothetical protein